MSARRLWLVRHPPVAVERGICYGRSDVALAAPVAAAAATLRGELPVGATILSSPLRRCAELARALSDTVTFDHRLQEMDFGEWEMRRYDTLPRADIDLWSADVWGFRIPGGESAADMAARAWAAWEEWGAPASGDLVVVAHGGPLRVMAGRLLGLPQSDWLDIACPQGACIKLESDSNGSWRRDETAK
ncbi:histidine phosphatase family protein [Methyloversatilis sp. MC4-4]|uniref:histidine phosphatase family protein n=1 Tax=Methyloversatilis sp. MC4-4 TaxID=3132824 RepID=UPI003CF6F2F1